MCCIPAFWKLIKFYRWNLKKKNNKTYRYVITFATLSASVAFALSQRSRVSK